VIGRRAAVGLAIALVATAGAAGLACRGSRAPLPPMPPPPLTSGFIAPVVAQLEEAHRQAAARPDDAAAVGRVGMLQPPRAHAVFADVTRQGGLEDSRWSTSAAFVDYGRDGLLDIVIVHDVNFSIRSNPTCRGAAGDRDYCGPQNFSPVPIRLYRNLGGGRFADVTRRAGITTRAAGGSST